MEKLDQHNLRTDSFKMNVNVVTFKCFRVVKQYNHDT